MPAHEAVPGLRPKVLLNMGIALEAEGRLQDACGSYRRAPSISSQYSARTVCTLRRALHAYQVWPEWPCGNVKLFVPHFGL